jgi:signal transduction histidine kinase
LSVGARLVEDGGRRSVEVVVADTGMGIDGEVLERLFEPYFSTKATGTGLGLAIAKRNITLNDGTIRVESEKGEGTRVYLTLPVAEKGETASVVSTQ